MNKVGLGLLIILFGSVVGFLEFQHKEIDDRIDMAECYLGIGEGSCAIATTNQWEGWEEECANFTTYTETVVVDDEIDKPCCMHYCNTQIYNPCLEEYYSCYMNANFNEPWETCINKQDACLIKNGFDECYNYCNGGKLFNTDLFQQCYVPAHLENHTENRCVKKMLVKYEI